MKDGARIPPEIGPHPILAHVADAPTGPAYLARLRRSSGERELALIQHFTVPELVAPAFVDLLSRSVERARALKHRCIAVPYSVGEHGGSPFVASEYVEGQAWSDARVRLWATGQLRRTVHVQILLEVLAALERAHAAGLVHAGVGSSCVFFGYDGRVKLGGFGVAAALAEQDCAWRSRSEQVYRAPEQSSGRFDHRADLYAVGVMLWEALARTPARPWDGVLPPIGDIVRDVPPGLAQVCDRALAVDPAARFQNAGDFQHALLSHRPVTAVHRSEPTLPRRPPPLPPAAKIAKSPGPSLGLHAIPRFEEWDSSEGLKAVSVLLCQTFSEERRRLNRLLAFDDVGTKLAAGAPTHDEATEAPHRPIGSVARTGVSRGVYSAVAAGVVAAVLAAGWSHRSAALDRIHSRGRESNPAKSQITLRDALRAGTRASRSSSGHREDPSGLVAKAQAEQVREGAEMVRAHPERDVPQSAIAGRAASAVRGDRVQQPMRALDLEFDAHLPRLPHRRRTIDEEDPYR